MRFVRLLVLPAILLQGCGPSPGSSPPSMPIGTALVTGSSAASPSAAAASASPFAGMDMIPPVAGFSRRDASDADLESFKAAVTASTKGIGSLSDAVATTLERPGDPPVTVIAFSLEPSPGRTQQDLLASIMGGMASALGEEWEPAAGGQAFAIRGQSTVAFITILAEEPFALFLFATGEAGAPVEEVVTGILEVYS